MLLIKRGDDADATFTAGLDVEEVPGHIAESKAEAEAHEQAMLMKAAKFARWLTLFLTIALLVLWPMPLYGSGYIFSKGFFTGWISGMSIFPYHCCTLLTRFCSWYLLALLLQLRSLRLPTLGRPRNHEAHIYCHLQGSDWQEECWSSWRRYRR
jgi:hypothetical protein